MTDTVLTYEQWLEANGLEKRLVVCEECCGTGDEQCDHCGTVLECDACDGRGEWDETKDEYEAQLKVDRAKMERHKRETAVGPLPAGRLRL